MILRARVVHRIQSMKQGVVRDCRSLMSLSAIVSFHMVPPLAVFVLSEILERVQHMILPRPLTHMVTWHGMVPWKTCFFPNTNQACELTPLNSCEFQGVYCLWANPRGARHAHRAARLPNSREAETAAPGLWVGPRWLAKHIRSN